MKSERRHELQHNALADWLAQAVESSKPHVNTILGGALVVVLLICGIMLLNRQSAQKTAEAWNKLSGVMNVDPMMPQAADVRSDLAKIASADSGTEFGQVAAVAAGDQYLELGSELLFENKAKANEELQQAITNYKIAINGSDPGLRQRATFGLARAYESSGEIDKAKDEYLRLAKGNGPFAKLAEDRAADLMKASTLKFYDRFARYSPAAPKSMPGVKLPFSEGSLQMPKEGGESEAAKPDADVLAPKEGESKTDEKKSDEASAPTSESK